MKAGDRVRLRAPSPLLALRSPFGVIVGRDPWDIDQWIVRLDETAEYTCGGQTETLAEISEHEDNLTVEVRA